MMEDVQRSKDAGFETHLTKPINFAVLMATIQKVLPSGTSP
jgi:CheY-like chemotaxis protein